MSQGAGPAVTTWTGPKPARDAAIDFWRGVILCTIFINHVPGNIFEHVTPRNFGFSDSSEGFVFISGVSLAMAYGRRFEAGRAGAAARSLGKRAVKLYAAHIGLSLIGLAIFAAGAAVFVDPALMSVHGRDLAIEDPLAAFAGLIIMGHQFGYFNILPLYVLLVAAVPALLWLNRFGWCAMVGGSLALYVATRVFALNIPTWPMQGTWFLDPFAWQLLLAIGLAVGLRRRTPGFKANPGLLTAAIGMLTFALICTTDGFGLRPGLYDAVRQWGDLDKTMLGSGRVLHFLALAYVIAALGLAARLKTTPLFAPLTLLGRHGLAVFLLLSVLAAVGQVITQTLGHSLPLDVTVIGGGLAMLYAAALALEAPRRFGVVELTVTLRRR